jgi:RNA polymerase subunit RPABC4/transcription elongation factor Spt4
MAVRECPSCAMNVDQSEEVCPICGYEFPVTKKGTYVVVWLMILLMIIWLVF